jgi:hypothetical protein
LFRRRLSSGKGCDAGLDGGKHIIGVLALLCEIALEGSEPFVRFRFILEARIVVYGCVGHLGRGKGQIGRRGSVAFVARGANASRTANAIQIGPVPWLRGLSAVRATLSGPYGTN